MEQHPNELPSTHCDVLVVGAGAGGLTTAVVARKLGLDVLVVEKEPVFGGTTAFSGGVLWIPLSPQAKKAGYADTREAALRYLRAETGRWYDDVAAQAFVDKGAEMVEYMERETEVKFIPTLYPDYHPDANGGVDIGRSILAAPYDIRALGKEMARLRPPLATITFIGMMFNSSNADLKHFFRFTRSWTSFKYVVKRLAVHMKELALHGRGVQVTSGNALAARLAKSALDLDIPIRTSTPAQELITEQGRVVGVLVKGPEGARRILAHRGVVLAGGGFSHDRQRTAQAYPHMRTGGEHFSPVPAGNTGDGARMAEQVGGRVEIRFSSPAAWMPTSKVPLGKGQHGAFPHLLDRYKPGIIGVLKNGRRFTNESNSYHDVGAAMVAANQGRDTAMWLVCDHATIRKYGLGYAKPAPMPLGPLVRKGYLHRAGTLRELARQAGIDADGLEQTVREYNEGAVEGVDRQFGRGTTSFNRYLADPEQRPNPCVAPVGKGPYYALRVVMGDLGTFDGLTTDVVGRVLDAKGGPIPGLYAVGNDRASVMGGNYPGAGITLGPIMTFGYITARHLAGLEPELSSGAQVTPQNHADRVAA